MSNQVPDEFTGGPHAFSHVVYSSPEFKAFCKRFGIAWGLPTKDITIHIPDQGLMTVTQSYQARDHNPEVKPDATV